MSTFWNILSEWFALTSGWCRKSIWNPLMSQPSLAKIAHLVQPNGPFLGTGKALYSHKRHTLILRASPAFPRCKCEPNSLTWFDAEGCSTGRWAHLIGGCDSVCSSITRFCPFDEQRVSLPFHLHHVSGTTLDVCVVSFPCHWRRKKTRLDMNRRHLLFPLIGQRRKEQESKREKKEREHDLAKSYEWISGH